MRGMMARLCGSVRAPAPITGLQRIQTGAPDTVLRVVIFARPLLYAMPGFPVPAAPSPAHRLSLRTLEFALADNPILHTVFAMENSTQ